MNTDLYQYTRHVKCTCTKYQTLFCFVIHCQQPNIIQHPVRQSVASETEAVFRVESTGECLQFQWQKNCIDLCDDGRYCGTNTDTLRIIEVEKGDKGCYRCLVKNDMGKEFSGEAFLTISKLVVTHTELATVIIEFIL